MGFSEFTRHGICPKAPVGLPGVERKSESYGRTQSSWAGLLTCWVRGTGVRKSDPTFVSIRDRRRTMASAGLTRRRHLSVDRVIPFSLHRHSPAEQLARVNVDIRPAQRVLGVATGRDDRPGLCYSLCYTSRSVH